MPGVFGIDQRQQRQFLLVRFCGPVRRIDRGACHTCQFALPGQRQGLDDADPLLAVFYWLIPDFFEPVQFHLQPPDLGIQPPGLADGSVGLGPRLASNRLDA